MLFMNFLILYNSAGKLCIFLLVYSRDNHYLKDFTMEHDMEIIASLNEDNKLTFLKVFAKLAAADGHIDSEEKDFIDDVALRYGIPSSRIAEIWQKESDEALVEEVKNIHNRRAALMLIKEMCFLSHADDDLSDNEVLFIGKIGEALGVSLEKIQEISNWVIDRLMWLERGRVIFEEVS